MRKEDLSKKNGGALKQIPRRDFLKSASAMAVGASWPERSLGQSKAASIRVGIIAEPSRHLRNYLDFIATSEGVGQVAIADESGQHFEGARAAFAKRPADLSVFQNHTEMIEKFRPRLIVINLEPHHCPEGIEAALKGNCHVLVGHPGAVRLSDFERIARVADSKGLHVMITFATRLSPQARKAKELVDSGFIGKLYGTTLNWIADQTRLRDTVYHSSLLASKRRMGGGKLIYHGIHFFDLIQFITGDRIAKVCGFSANVGGQPIEVEDAAVLALQFRSGMVGTLNTGYYLDRGYQNSVVLWGSEGWLRFDQPYAKQLEWYSTLAGAPTGIQTFTHPSGLEVNNYQTMIQNAVNVARGIDEPFVTTAESLKVLDVVFSAYRAFETGSNQSVR